MGNNSHAAALSNNRGELGEAIARAALAHMGYINIKKGRGKWLVTGWVNRAEWIAHVVADPEQKINPDWQAIEPTTGRAVWAEVKARADRLPYSALKDHQRSGLDNHGQNNGIALLVWVDPTAAAVAVFNWPIQGFKPGSSLSLETAAAQAVYFNSFDQLLIGEMIEQLGVMIPAGGSVDPVGTVEINRDPVWQRGGDRPCPECKTGRMYPTPEPYGGKAVYVCDNCNIGQIEG